MPEPELEKALIDTLADEGALDIASDAAEMALDAFLEDGPLKEIPFFKYVLAAIRAPGQVRDLLLGKKLAKFFKPLAAIPEQERQEFVENLDRDPAFRRKVGAQILLLVDRLDDFDKPELVALAFTAYVSGAIAWDQFQELGVVIDRCVVSDLARVSAADRPARFPAATATRLSGCGVIEIAVIPSVPGTGASNEYSLTDLGRLVVQLGLNEAAAKLTGR